MSTLNQQDASQTDTIKTTRHGITPTRSNAPNRRRVTRVIGGDRHQGLGTVLSQKEGSVGRVAVVELCL